MKNAGVKPDHVLFNTVVNGCLYHYSWELACKYTLESFTFNIRMADDIYSHVLEKICSYNCNLRNNLKCDYATNIIKNLKDRNVDIDEDLYSKVAQMIYKIKGVKLGFSPENKNNKKFESNQDIKNVNRDNLKNNRKNIK
jgi:hypothetical protein